jgi:mannose-6-phosphate isomerase
MGLLRFEEAYFERIWGGEKLRTLYGKSIPPNALIGEAWLIADHPQHESIVAEGPHRGRTLRSLLEEYPQEILGARPRLTPHGRFPLLLKILDARDVLSVQVHPDDACAMQLGEPDAGKTEMWHVLQADPHSELICGLKPDVTPEALMQSIHDGSIKRLMQRFEVSVGDSVFVPAGTVHAIGAGVVLAEIQQNSDLTYRLYDWQRVDASGRPRPLHVEKALKAIHFGCRVSGVGCRVPPASGLRPPASGLLLAKCPYFVAECVQVRDSCERPVQGETFHIALVIDGPLDFVTDDGETNLCPGQALLVPASAPDFRIRGVGAFLDYYVAS